MIVYCNVYTALVLAATTSQRRPSLPVTNGNSELSYILYRRARADISPRNFHLQRTVANDNSPLLGYNRPSASDVSRLIYVDRMIIVDIYWLDVDCL